MAAVVNRKGLREVIVIKVGIVGGTGYTGVELLRLLAGHREVEVTVITSRAESGVRVADLYPSLRGVYDLAFTVPDPEALANCDVVFFATPHGVAQSMMAEIIASGVKVIDLSADFRIRNIPLWEKWYGQEHACPELVDTAVYGLPEVNREAIKKAQLIACPGCYPTSAQLALLPLIKQGWVDTTDIIVNAASGASGAGRQGKIDLLLSENSDSYKAYGVAGHRHLPEIEQGLSDMQPEGSAAPSVTFVPHLLPMIRGIHATVYVDKTAAAGDVQALFESFYENEPFVDVLPAGSHPQTRTVKGANVCRLAVHEPQERGKLVILSVIDNLTKGAAGQAVQCMNIAFGFDESEGLRSLALMP